MIEALSTMGSIIVMIGGIAIMVCILVFIINIIEKYLK